MTASPKRKKKAGDFKKPHKQQTSLVDRKNNKPWFVVFAIAVILAAIPFAMGKYIEFNSPGAYDSGAYVYSAKHILDGAKIGVDEIPSAQPGTLLVNMLGVWLFGFSETGPELIQTLLQITALLLMFFAMRKAFGQLAAVTGVIIASIYLSAPLMAKFGNVKEQYMIAFMVMGISALVMRQMNGHWLWAILAGACLAWAPLFKPTGTTAIGATGLFIIFQPILKNRTWKQTFSDILFLIFGATLSLAPVYLWLLVEKAPVNYLPYSFVLKTILPAKDAAQAGGYIKKARELVPFSTQWPRVLRYYWALSLPVALAIASIIVRIIKMVFSGLGKSNSPAKTDCDKFVLLLGIWWILDMAFVWISPRSYEQYYLPLNASAAMLSGYLIYLYSRKFSAAIYKGKWLAIGMVGFICMAIMSSHIFAGVTKSPYSGADYGYRKRGYLPRIKEINKIREQKQIYPWQAVGDYIRLNSTPEDKIYVWGWYPGIYVQAQRLSPASKAFMMPRPSPEKFETAINKLLSEFEREKPKFIVDSRKRHIPMDRPPYELWPKVPKGFMGSKKGGFLPPDKKQLIAQFETIWADMLKQRFDDEEAERYKLLKPFREFVMNNYEIVSAFGEHVLFQLKDSTDNKELQ